MNQGKLLFGAIGLVVLIMMFSVSVFTVRQNERALVLRLGQIRATDYAPGIHLKLPIFDTVRLFDARIITMDAERERNITAEKKNVVVDAFAKWRIANVPMYFTSMGGDINRANSRIAQILKQELRSQFGKRSIQEVVSGERDQVMGLLTTNTAQQVKDFGIEVVDVRIKRVDLPEEVSGAVYQRMEAERTRVAKDLRSRGAEAAERIRADADRQRTVLLAEAYGQGERLRGEGDAKASEIYAQAYQQDAEFYDFYRSMTSYKKAFRDKNGLLVLQPDTPFFKYFDGVNKSQKQ